MVSEKIIIDRIDRIRSVYAKKNPSERGETIRLEYEKRTLSEIIKEYDFIFGYCPSQGKMSDETYKKRLIEDLVEDQLKFLKCLLSECK